MNELHSSYRWYEHIDNFIYLFVIEPFFSKSEFSFWMVLFKALQVHKDILPQLKIVPSEVVKMGTLEAMYRKIESEDVGIFLTVEFLAWVAMHALIPFNSAFSLQHSVFLSNPVQAFFYHYLVTEFLCYGMESGLALKLPGDVSSSSAEHSQFLERKKRESNRMKEICKEYCSRPKISIILPQFEEFYFQPLEDGEDECDDGSQNDEFDPEAFDHLLGEQDTQQNTIAAV